MRSHDPPSYIYYALTVLAEFFPCPHTKNHIQITPDPVVAPLRLPLPSGHGMHYSRLRDPAVVSPAG